MLIFVPIMGFQSGLASFTGQNMGAARLDRIKRGLIASTTMSLIFTVSMSLIFYIFAEPLVSFFGLTDSSVEIGARMLRFLSMFLWMFAAYMTLCGVLQGSGDTITMSVVTLTGLGLRILTGYLAVHLGLLGPEAAWVTNPIGWTAALAIAYIRYFTGGWKNKAIAGRFSAPRR
jgi:Na+-driven multidrug efflux pump